MLSKLKEKQEDNSYPIAIITGGKDKGKLIFITPDSKNGFHKIKLKGSGKLAPMAKPFREFNYVAAPSGAGKTRYCAQYIYNWKILFPKGKVFVFSRLTDDEDLDMLGVIRVPLDDDLIENIDDITEGITDALFLFDDIDTIKKKPIKEAVYKIQADVLEVGRHSNNYVLATSHLISGNDRSMTRTILNEAHSVTLFPKGGDTYSIEQYLGKHMGMSQKNINKIIDLPSRWVTIGKHYPQYVFYEKGAYMLMRRK